MSIASLLSPAAFPHAVTIVPAAYSPGASGGAIRTDGAGVAGRANVKLASDDKVIPSHPDEGHAAGSRTLYDVSFPGSPAGAYLSAVLALQADDTLTTGSANPFPPMALVAIGPVVPALAGAWYRGKFELRK